MMDAIGSEGGIVNQIIGDGLMAILARRCRARITGSGAVVAARQMVDLIRLSQRSNRQHRAKFKSRSGLASHRERSWRGYTGTQHRATYTCVGDTVNVAAGLESHTKGLKRPILIDENTRLGLEDGITVEGTGRGNDQGQDTPRSRCTP